MGAALAMLGVFEEPQALILSMEQNLKHSISVIQSSTWLSNRSYEIMVWANLVTQYLGYLPK